MDAMLKRNTVKDTACETPISEQTARQVKVGNSSYKIVSIFSGKKTSSELVYDAAVKKILYEELKD